MSFICESCDKETPRTFDAHLHLVLCESCETEAVVSDAADAVLMNGELIDVQYRALCEAWSTAL